MSKILLLYLSILLFYPTQKSQAQCSSNELEVVVEVVTDNYGYETSWSITNSGGSILANVNPGDLANNTSYIDTICVSNSDCYTFLIEDAYGDGICCAHGNGSFAVIVDGDTLIQGGNFTTEEQHTFNCPPGSSCAEPDTVLVGTHTASTHDHWYVFTPNTTGMYEVTTCGLNTCNTKIWIYDICAGLIWDDLNTGTIFYDDTTCSNGTQAVVTAAMQAGITYYIRIGDSQDDCAGQSINWNLNFTGPISGCTDPTACNYNPLATVSDTCIYPGDPACPDGPDLVLLGHVLENSMYLTQYNNTDNCFVVEECLTGMGQRDIVRFTTHIENNGSLDYYVGDPSNNPDQFNNNNCHGHWHYEGYAEYILYDQNGNALPIGFKSGFCVMDLVCDHGGTAQYGCSTMGITAGCGDIYSASLDCQWIDVTTVPDGDYTFVARVNWDNSPDGLGRYELDMSNNWAQTCINLDRSSGSLEMTIDPNCPQFVDCAGQPFGNAVPDCEGNCAGVATYGDLNGDTTQTSTDISLYLDGILDGSLSWTTCTDLYQDSTINIFDAALLAQCLQDSSQCDFPDGLINIFDTTKLSISGADFGANYVDIALRNPMNEVLAYQFTMSGIEIDSVVSLVDPIDFPFDPVNSTIMVASLSMDGSEIDRTATAAPLCRIYFSTITDSEICIDEIQSIVNKNYQQTISVIEGSCVQVPTVVNVGQLAAQDDDFRLKVAPNPLQSTTRFSFYNPNQHDFQLEIMDATGRLLEVHSNLNGEEFTWDASRFSAGVYWYRFSNAKHIKTGRLILQK
ncbi:MAG: T9SS type A sorting domain-containing protein [Saprospiraceae bacterium]|nr:T9SS type A sorting domain-containing protein [Saprospiraceae bacterium]